MRMVGRIVWVLVLLVCIFESVGFIVDTCTPTGSFATGKLTRVAQAQTAALAGALLVLAVVLLGKTTGVWMGGGAEADGSKASAPGAWGRFLGRGKT